MKPKAKQEEQEPYRASVDEIKETAKRLAEMSELRYQEVRLQTADALGISVSDLDGEVKRQRKILQDELKITDRISLTDAGNAIRFVERNSLELRFCQQRSKTGWFWWNGHYWQPDALGQAMELGRQTSVAIAAKATFEYGRQVITDQQYRAEMGWSLESLSDKLLSAMLRQAAKGTALCVPGEAFDARPELLNLQNLTIDLNTMKVYPPKREDLITQAAGVKFVPTAVCPKWEKFVSDSLQGDLEQIEYLRRASGYMLTGSQREQCFFLVVGAPGTGKSTYWRVMMHLLGDYFCIVPSGLFVKKSVYQQSDGEAATPGLTKLVGKRVAASVELSEGDKFASALLKQITGGEAMTCRPLYGEHFTFQPQCKPIFLSNHVPGTSDFTGALQDRLRIIKFNHVVRGTPQENKNLVDELKAEGPGILKWCLRGLREYQAFDGLREPVIVKSNVEEYFESENVVARFLKERAEHKKAVDGKIPAGREGDYATFSQMYACFKYWAKQNEEVFGSSKWFSIRMKQLGYTTVEDREHMKYFQFKLLFPDAVDDPKKKLGK